MMAQTSALPYPSPRLEPSLGQIIFDLTALILGRDSPILEATQANDTHQQSTREQRGTNQHATKTRTSCNWLRTPLSKKRSSWLRPSYIYTSHAVYSPIQLFRKSSKGKSPRRDISKKLIQRLYKAPLKNKGHNGPYVLSPGPTKTCRNSSPWAPKRSLCPDKVCTDQPSARSNLALISPPIANCSV